MSVFYLPAAPVDLFNEQAFSLGAFRACPAVRELQVGRHVERLEPRVFQVLVVLARSQNRTISRDALLAQCWSGRFVSDDALNRTIGKLRQVFARDPSNSVTIETVPRLGYQLRVEAAPNHVRPDHRIVVSETATEVDLDPGQTSHAIQITVGAGGSLLKLTIQMAAAEPVPPSVAAARNSRTAERARYKAEDHR